MKTTCSAIELAVQVLGGTPSTMAAALGGKLKRQHVEYWLKTGLVPAEHAPAVEEATRKAGRVVRCEALCPNVRWDVLRKRGAREPAI